MIRKAIPTVMLVWFLVLNGLGVDVYSAEQDELEAQIIFFEYALKNKSFTEIGELVGKFQPDDFTVEQPLLSRYSDRLIAIGRELLIQEQKESAYALFEKVLHLDPTEWRAVSYLNQYRDEGELKVKQLLGQLKRMMRSFEPSVILITQVNEALLWAVMFTLLAFAVWLIRHYLPLATHDMIHNDKGFVDKGKLAIWLLLLLWPVFLFAGWFLLVMVVIAALWFYTDKTERKVLTVLLAVLAFMTLLNSVNQFLLHQLQDASFIQTKKIIEGNLLEYDGDSVEKNHRAKLLLAYNNFHSGNLEEGMEWLNAVDEAQLQSLRKNLYGYAFLINKDYVNAINSFSEVLTNDASNQTALYNLTLALLENNDEKSYEAYSNRFSKLTQYKEKVGRAKLPPITQRFLWSLFISAGKGAKEATELYVVKSTMKSLFRMPILYFFLIIILYIKFLPVLFHNIGKSTHCAKCQKAINKPNTSRAVNVCNDCYQLFLIKDSMMSEAKTFKEAEINRENRRKNMLLLLFSFLSPGFFLHMRGQHRLFAFLNFFYFLFLIIAFAAWHPLAQYYGAVPLFAKAFAILTAAIYIIANSMIFQGDEYGF